MVQSRQKKDAIEEKVRKALIGDYALDHWHNFRVNPHNFTIYVGGDPSWEDYHDVGGEPGVEYRMADRLDINLSFLSGISKTRPILLQVASCGGNWDEGMQMFGAILTCPNPITVIATKWARSMTSIIPLAADRFVMRPPAKYMFHHGTVGFEGIVQQVDTEYVELVKAKETMKRIYIARLKEQGKFSKWSPSRISNMLDRQMEKNIDVWLDGHEAVQWGFVDAIYDGDEKNLRAKTKNAARREKMFEVLRKPITVELNVK